MTNHNVTNANATEIDYSNTTLKFEGNLTLHILEVFVILLITVANYKKWEDGLKYLLIFFIIWRLAANVIAFIDLSKNKSEPESNDDDSDSD